MIDLKKPLTTGQIASALCVSTRTVGKWIDRGDLAGYALPGGHHRRVPVHQLLDFMREHEMPLELLRGLIDQEATACPTPHSVA
jgi:excisionase family DNA binding protein